MPNSGVNKKMNPHQQKNKNGICALLLFYDVAMIAAAGLTMGSSSQQLIRTR